MATAEGFNEHTLSSALPFIITPSLIFYHHHYQSLSCEYDTANSVGWALRKLCVCEVYVWWFSHCCVYKLSPTHDTYSLHIS